MTAGKRRRKTKFEKPSISKSGKSAAETWNPPSPVGYPASIQSLGGFAAPLLAAASFTMTALLFPTLSAASQQFVRWPDFTLTLFVASGLAQVAAVQAAMWARRYDASPEELSQWYPDEVEEGRPTRWLRNVQRSHLELSQRWANRTRYAYHAGILLLLGGLAIALIPVGHMTVSRWILVSTACLGPVGELSWIIGSSFFNPRLRRIALVRSGCSVSSLVLLVVVLSTSSSAAMIVVLLLASGLMIAELLLTYFQIVPEWPHLIPLPGNLLKYLVMSMQALIVATMIVVSLVLVIGGSSVWLRFALGAASAITFSVEFVQVLRLLRMEKSLLD